MNLTPEQLRVIRESVTDDKAYERVVSLFNEGDPPSPPLNPASEAFLFSLDQEQIALLTAVLNAIPVAIYIKDLDTRFVIANQPTLSMLNAATQDEILGKTDFDLMEEYAAQYHYERELELLRTGEALFDLETSWEDPHLGHRWVLTTKSPIRNTSGEIVGLIGVNREITRQKLTEQSLESQRNLLQTIIDHIQDKIYIKDRQSHFIGANAATVREQRLAALEDIVGTTDFDFMDAARAQMMLEEEQRIMASGQPMINQELFTPAEVTRHQDEWYLISKVPVLDEHGEVRGLVGVNRNITSRKLAERRRIELELERERSNIMSEFIADSSNEFRTPLSVILTSTFLLERTESHENQQEFVAHIREQIDRLTNLIDSLQLMVRLDRETSLDLRPFDLDSFLKHAVDNAQRTIQDKNLALCLEATPSASPAFADEEMLATALAAILNNAIRYTPDDGQITIRSHWQEKRLILAVEDTGVGMSDEIMSRAFNRFYRGDEAHSSSGFGLGLPIARRIVELHRGKIEVESQIGAGSTVRITLPQTIPQAEQAAR